MAKVQMACRDCKKCTNSALDNFGRNTGRVLAAGMTGGLSEAGFLVTKKCRQCAHPLSLHSGNTHLTANNRPWSNEKDPAAPQRPRVPLSHNLDQASAGLSDTERSIHRTAIESLPFLLSDDEVAVLVCAGSQQVPGKFLPKATLVVLTDRWLWVVPKDAPPEDTYAIDFRDTSTPQLTYNRTMIGDSMQLDWPDGSQLSLSTISRNGRNLEAAISKLRTERVSESTAASCAPVLEAAAPPPTDSSTSDKLALLKGLGELHLAGVLTDEEFDAQKARILEQL